MSTKTNFKRVALVAVAALGLGVLTSVAPANAGALTADAVYIVPATSGVATAGVCVIDPKALVADSSSAVNTATVIQVGASLTFKATTHGTGSLVISGPATWTSASTNSVSIDAKTVSSNATSSTITLVDSVLTASAVGSIVVTAYTEASGGGSPVETFGITVVAACSSAAVPVAANSMFTLTATEDTSVTSASTDAELAYADMAYTATDVHINVLLLNAYKGELSTAGVLTATATNGALIGFNGPGISSTAFVGPTIAGAAENVDLQVSHNKVANPGAALSTTITFQFNGVTVGTKDVKLYGAPSQIVVSDVTVGDTADGGTFKYVVKDNAGNQVDTPDATLSGAKAGITYGTIVSAATGIATGSTTLAKGDGTFACAAGKSGSQDIQIGFVNAALATVKSNTFTATCGQSTVDTFSVSMDKASYSPGEIATLTIKGLDENGGIVSDNAIHGAGVSSLSIPGMTIIGAAATSADTFTAGALTYKFRVDQAEGSFVGQALVTATTDTKAETVSYSIKSTAGGVTNADVLKAIVSLIASINKQIAALQKALLRR